MDISSFTAPQGYAAARPATRPEPQAEFVEGGLKSAATDFAATLQKSENTAMAAMSGDADPHALVLALAQTKLAVETAVTVRNKVVEAYKQILRMPV